MSKAQKTQTAASYFDRQPPFNQQAEVGVVGGLFLLPQQLDDVATTLKSGDFYDEACGKIYQTMVELRDEGTGIDPVTVINRLKAKNLFEQCGGSVELSRIINAVPNAAHTVFYADIVHDAAVRRSIIVAATQILRDGYDSTEGDAGDLANQSEALLAKAVEQGLLGKVNIRKVSEAATTALAKIAARMQGLCIEGVATGFGKLDEILGGLRFRELCILGARPSQGKTALGLGIAANVAYDQNQVLFCSLEMGEGELLDRLLSAESEISLKRIREGQLNAQEFGDLQATADSLSGWPLWIEDATSRTMSEISAIARRHKRKHGLKLLLIDYLQLIQPENSRDARTEQIGKITRRLKSLAKELDIAVCALAQVNRTAGDLGRAPRLSELRESGNIEQDADTVVFIHRPSEYDKSKLAPTAFMPEQAELHVAKGRNSGTGEAPVGWIRGLAKFVNLSIDNHAAQGESELPP